MDISIKQAKEADWQDLRSIRLKALQTDPSVFGSDYQKESVMTEADWKSWLQTDDTAIFLIYENATLIGMTGIAVDRDDPTKKRALLWGSWLEPSVRGKGVSQIIYQKRIAWAERHPTIEQIIVSHRASNLSSKHANQKHGFKFTHIEDKIWPDGTKDDNIFYALNAKPIQSYSFMKTVISGRVQSGKKDASRWLDKFNEPYSKKTGMAIFPGSLNVALDENFDWFAPAYQAKIIRFGKEEYGGERDILLLPCVLRNLENKRAFLWTATTAARDRPDPWVVEVISDVKLREVYGLTEGSIVEIELDL